MEELIVNKTLSKEEKYKILLPQIKALLQDEDDLIANMANICAALKEVFNFFWVGFYINKNEELVLGPFQGPIACTRIAMNKGVCGKAAKTQQTIVVADVELFEDHIACSALSKSEIVVPKVKLNKTLYVLDIDSDKKGSFNLVDKNYLEKLVSYL